MVEAIGIHLINLCIYHTFCTYFKKKYGSTINILLIHYYYIGKIRTIIAFLYYARIAITEL